MPEIAAQETPTPQPRALADSAREIAARIAQLRARQGRVALTTGLAMAIAAVCAWLVSETVTDFLANLPWFARLAFFIAGIGGACALAWWFGVRPWRRRIDDETVALMIERELPEFRSRFIAAVQLAKAEAASPGLVKALIAETTAMAAKMKFDSVVKTGPIKKWLRIAALALFAAAALAAFGRNNTLPLVMRACLFNNPVPRKTLIRELACKSVIAIGDDLRIEAVAGGIIPAKGALRFKTANSKPQEFEMTADPARPTHFARVLQSVQESFEFTVTLGDAQSASFQVRVKPRPAVASVECRQVWPAYTRLPEQRRALGDLKILAGSRLVLKARSSVAVKSGEIRLVGADRDKALRTAQLNTATQDKTQLAGEITIPPEDTTGMTLWLVDEDGVVSRGSAIYHIDVIHDAAPTIKITYPDRREILLTRDATALIAFEAKDDFGVAKVKLHYAVDWTEGATYKTIDLDLRSDLPKTVARRFEWKVGAIVPHVEEGSVIDYWFEVFDANNVTGPGIGTIEHYQARIVSDFEKRADLANQLSDTMEGLNGVRQGQEEMNAKLGEIIFEKPPNGG